MGLKTFAAGTALLLLCASVGSVAGQGNRPNSGGFGGSGGSGFGGSGSSGGNKPPFGGSGGSSGQGGFGGSGGTGGGGSSGFGGSGGSSGGGGSTSGFGGSGGSSGGGGSSGFGGSGGSGGGGSSGFGGSGGSWQSIQMCHRLTPKKDAVFTSADIPCKGQSKCQVCGGPDRVRDACAANPACIAFSYQVSTKCGYLKAKAATSIMLAPQRDWVTYAGAKLFPQEGVAAASILDLCVMLRPLTDRNVLGFDMPCNGKDRCEVCGTVDKIKAWCTNSANCKGFTWNPATNCGLLKQETDQGLVNAKGWLVYTRA
uniref:Apple domain-containing protein n=1 Tax=Tetradesmus obliquus TaxID=3088 RepID=A0A383W9F7_TETOB|eukprot:jgi/Sobl393_1/15841/SZX73644.1